MVILPLNSKFLNHFEKITLTSALTHFAKLEHKFFHLLLMGNLSSLDTEQHTCLRCFILSC